MLPDPRPAARRRRGRGLAAHRADAGPGGRPAAGGSACRVPELDAHLRRSSGNRDRRPRGIARPALRRAGTPGGRAHPRAAGHDPHRPLRHRRSALRLAVGPRFPAGVPPALGAARTPPRRAANRADGHRGRADPARDRRASRARGRACLRQRLRPAEHPLRHRAEAKRARSAPALPRSRAPRPRGHRLLPVAPQGRGDGAMAARAGIRRPALPRGHERGRAQAPPGRVRARGRGRHRRHHRVRHGDRQARRALRRPSRPAEEHRVLLPGDRTRRPRRRTGRRLDGVRTLRRRHPAPDGRGLDRRGAAQAHRGAQARRPARPVRADDLPSPVVARVLRRGAR